MTKLLTGICFLLSFTAGAQEALEPLKYNPALLNRGEASSAASTSERGNRSGHELDGSYIYKIDTLDLPFIDDFSTDKFKKFNATSGDANVSDTVFYRILISGNPDLSGNRYVSDTVFNLTYDSVGGNLVETKMATTPLTISVCNLDAYPIACQAEEVWVDLVEIDSLWTGTSPDLITFSPSFDFEQDSIQIFFVDTTAEDLKKLWADNFTYRNFSFGVNPPTIGVATFDGLDKNGIPYNFNNPSAYGVADVLTSKPIRLFTKPATGNYTPQDSVYISFFYQPQGLGEVPDNGDSLTLQFYDADAETWHSVWKANGEAVKPFKQVMVPIKDVKYFKDGFRFRFRNYGNLSGALDHWHVDYVYLNINRTIGDTIRDDVAFRYPVHTLLNEYTAMPWTHYQTNPSLFMKAQAETSQYNNNNTARNVANQMMRIFRKGTQMTSLVGPNFPFIAGYTSFNSNYNLASNSIFFDPLWADTIVTFDVTFEHSVTPDALRDNDTIRHQQVFVNYYAYDDGTAEAAYGLVGTGSQLAYKFSTPVADTIRAVKINFTASVNDATNDPFILTVWGDSGGKPGGVLMENDLMLQSPSYDAGQDGFVEYPLQHPIVVSGTFYVGMRQTTANRLNIGFDANRNFSSKIFYNTGGTWLNTSFQGSLMIRPVFVTKADGMLLQVKENDEKFDFAVYPNPADWFVTVNFEELPESLELLDMQGRLVMRPPILFRTEINTSSLANGVYLIRALGKNGIPAVQKIVIRH